MTVEAVAYRKFAAETGARDPEIANAAHDKMHRAYKLLRESEAGRAAIFALTTDPDPHVRCWSAAHSLVWQPEHARAVLEKLVIDDGVCSFTARMTLREFDAGRLSFA